MSPADQVRRWSDELARDPASTAFLPLARSYRESGRAEAARRLCLRGLERHPHHVEAHVLLGELYADAGEVVKAHDEWDIALSLDPAHLHARRHLGMLLAEMGEDAASRRHLQAVLRERPEDEEVTATLARLQDGEPSAGAPAAHAPAPQPARRADTGPSGAALASVGEERGMRGALLLDEDGLLLGGVLRDANEERTSEVAAALQDATGQARRALDHLGLGSLNGLVVETERTRLRVEPLEEALLAVVAEQETPLGWLMRRTRQLRGAAAELLGPSGA